MSRFAIFLLCAMSFAGGVCAAVSMQPPIRCGSAFGNGAIAWVCR